MHRRKCSFIWRVPSERNFSVLKLCELAQCSSLQVWVSVPFLHCWDLIFPSPANASSFPVARCCNIRRNSSSIPSEEKADQPFRCRELRALLRFDKSASATPIHIHAIYAGSHNPAPGLCSTNNRPGALHQFINESLVVHIVPLSLKSYVHRTSVDQNWSERIESWWY